MKATLERLSHKVLMVDDEVNILHGYRRTLRGYNILTANSAREALEVMNENPDIAVVASDYHMPLMDGLSFISAAREIYPDCVYLMITGDDEQQTAVSAINTAGIFRFINKPCKPDILIQTIDEAIVLHDRELEDQKLIEESSERLSELSDKIDHQKQHDALTGLGNRLLFQSALNHKIDEGMLVNYAVACFDIDFFRVINDVQGLDAGDCLLQNTANLLKRKTRAGDTVARLSDDTFLLLLENKHPEETVALLSDLKNTFSQYGFHWHGKRHEVSATVGLVHLSDPNMTAESVIRMAEVARQLARDESHQGFYISKVNDLTLLHHYDETRIVEEVRLALNQDRFELYQQKIVPTNPDADGIHLEILLRLKDSRGKDLSPATFVPVAERYRLSTQIDERVIRGVSEWFTQNQRVLDRISLCSINLSATTLRNPAFVDYMKERFEAAGVPAEKLCFEITETSAMDNVQKAIEFITAAREHGFKIAIDDFGTGYSSFAYLRSLPADYLKIDGAFISKLDQNEVDRVITASINNIAHALGKKTIAEYVENEAIAGHLTVMGVDYLQGFHIAQPQPLAVLARLN